MRKLHELHEEFLLEQEYVTRLSPATLTSYKTSFDVFSRLSQVSAVDELTPALLTEFFKSLQMRPRYVGRRVRRGVRSSTIASYRARLGRFFNWLKERQLIDENPMERLPAPRVTYEERKYLGKSDVERVVTTVTHFVAWRSPFLRRRNALIFSLLLNCGLRKGELLGLQVRDVDLERRELAVRASTSKARRDRRIPLNRAVLRDLEDYMDLRNRGEYRCLSLLVSDRGDVAFTASGLKHLVALVSERSGVRFHLHQFRHTFAINMLHNGCDLEKLRRLLGHRDITMTSTYLRCLPVTAMRADVDRLTLDNLL